MKIYIPMRIQFKQSSILFLLLFISACILSQNINTDSLKKRMSESSGRETVKILLELSETVSKDSSELSLKYSKQALKLSENNNYAEERNKALSIIGNICLAKSEYDSAVWYFLKAFKKIKHITANKTTADLNRDIGKAYLYKNDYSDALSYFMKALKVYIIIGDSKSIGNIYNDLGLVYLKLKNYSDALIYFNKAFVYSEKINNNEKKAVVLNNIGTVYIKENKPDFALRAFKKSLVFQNELEKNDKLASIYNNIGSIYFQKNELDSALFYLNKSFQICNERNFKFGQARILINTAKIYIEKKDYKKAAFLLKRAEKIALFINSKELINNTYSALYQLNYNIKNYKKACDYLLASKKYSDSVFNEKKSRQIQEIKIKYESDKKNKQIELLKKEHELEKNKIKRQKLYRNSLFAIIALICIVIIIIYYDNQIKKNLNAKLNSKQIFLNTILNTNPNPIYFKNINGEYIGCNNSFLKIVGLSRKELIGKTAFDFINIHMSFEHERMDKEILKNPRIKEYYSTVVLHEGDRREYKIIKTVHRNEKQEIGGILGIMVDITQIKNQEKKIREQQEILHKRKTDKLKNELDNLRSELALNTIQMIKDSKQISKFISDINSLKSFLNKTGLQNAQTLINQYKFQNEERDWEEFVILFKQVHNDFYVKLETLYPALTQNDKRICIFLFLKMTSSQIANITYKSLRTIESNRARIRKKLNISDPEISLTSFLQNL